MPVIKIELSAENMAELCHGGEIVVCLPKSGNDHADSIPCVKQVTLFEYASRQIQNMNMFGKERTVETYKAAIQQFSKFRNGEDLLLSAITPELIENYQQYLRGRNMAMNSISFLMRILRAIYNKAVSDGLSLDRHPFLHAYTGQAKTVKRAIALKELQSINNLELKAEKLRFARDMFMFSFYTRGMSFVDMAYLRRSDIRDGHLSYKRRKTGQLITIKWERQMQEIVNRYPNRTTGYLLPFITKDNGKERNQYRNHQTHINKWLKEIARLVGMSTNLTMYCARHSWATIARELGVPMNVISRALGHSDEKTTEIYIRSVDISCVDEANANIICKINDRGETTKISANCVQIC